MADSEDDEWISLCDGPSDPDKLQPRRLMNDVLMVGGLSIGGCVALVSYGTMRGIFPSGSSVDTFFLLLGALVGVGGVVKCLVPE